MHTRTEIPGHGELPEVLLCDIHKQPKKYSCRKGGGWKEPDPFTVITVHSVMDCMTPQGRKQTNPAWGTFILRDT